MKTPLNQPVQIGQATFYTHPCKYEDECSSYNPALKLTETVGVAGYPGSFHEIEKINRCVMGGGCGCYRWRGFTKKCLGAYEKPNSGK